MKETILNSIIEKHNSSKGSCGTRTVDLKSTFNISTEEIKAILKELHSEKKIKFRKGINGYLIFKI